MDAEVKQRNRRRKRAQRMQQAAQREIKITSKDGDSAEEDSESAVIREKPQRPLIRRKKSKEPLVEEDIIDGFSILGFKSYEDLESVIKLAGKDVKRLLDEKAPRHETRPHITHHISAHPTPVHGLTLTHQDPGTSDDSGRASERLTGSSVAPRDADSSRDRLSDASSRCSSGKGYICDSEGEDDKGSDASSVIFGSIPTSRKHEFPGAVPSSLPLSNGTSNSPVPAPTPPNIPAPSPAPAQQPPTHPISNHRTGTTTTGAVTATVSTVSSGVVTISSSTAVPITMPQPAAAPVAHHPPAFVSTTNHGRTESPAVATSANAAVAPSGNSTAGGQYHHPTFQPLYTPYAVHSTFSSQSPAPPVPSVITTTTVPTTQQPPTTVVQTLPAISSSHRDSIVSRTASPKVHSPSRERESYSNVSSLSRSSVTPINCPPPTTVSSLTKVWSGTASGTRLSPAPPRPTPPLHSSFPSPMFTTPLPPPTTSASSLTSTVPQSSSNPNPFSAENLFQSNQADMLRRELDNRFLASQDRSLNIGPPPYLRAEMHQHQHHHTHVHQHTTSILPPPPPTASTIFPPPLVSQFKEIPKLGGMDSSFYRQNLSLPGYPGYSPSILHSGLTGPTPFVPPNHLPSFQPKPTPQSDPSKPKIVKAGKWNAMHVRIAWEVYHHQQKESKGGTVKPDLLRTPSHLFPPSVPFSRPHEIQFPPTMASHRPPTFEQQHPGIFGSAGSHLGNTLSPFARYGAGFSSGGSPFSVSPLVGRDLQLGSLHDPWRGLQRSIPVFPPSVNPLPPTVGGLPPPAPWSLKPDPVLEQREREERERAERERERLRREREERERREREEKQRKLEQQQQERERERREKERREHERREMERQQERERMLHQQRLVESSKQMPSSMLRDRSPLRNGSMDPNEIRIKEEPRIKEEDRYHPYVRQHPVLQHSLPQMMDRSRVLPPPYPPPPSSHWPPPPPHADPYYRAYEPLRYNSLMDAAMRAEEERVKLFSAYQHHAQFRPKDPSLLHLRAGSGPGPPPPAHKLCATPPTDLHKKEEPR